MAIWNLSFGGTLYDDIWQCTMYASLVGTPGGPIGSTSPLMNDIVDDVKTFFAASRSSQQVKLGWVKFNEVDPVTKKYVSQTETTEQILSPPVPGPVGAFIPPQQTLAISWVTGAKRGIAAKGRIYPPATAVTVGTDGNIDETQRLQLANAAKTFVNNLNNAPGPDLPGTALTIVVLGYNGSNRPVTGVRVGNKLDTQRRRRNASPEVYSQVAL